MRVVAIKNPKSEVERRLIHEMHRLRARIFRGRLAWTVRCTSGLEIDGFDKLKRVAFILPHILLL
jgi:acyl homoserine lactone synthase